MGGRESLKVPWIRAAVCTFLGVGVLLGFADGYSVTNQDGVEMLSPGPNFHGNPLIQRATYVTGLDRMWIIPKLALPMGRLKKFMFYVWEYNARLTNEIHLQIWRPVSLPYSSMVDSSLMLVWEYRVTVDLNTAGSLYTISMGAGEEFLVKEGDVIGWTTTAFLLPFACSYSSTNDVYLTSYQGSLPTLRSSHTFGPFGGYKYKCSVGVEIEPITATTAMMSRTTRPTMKTTTYPGQTSGWVRPITTMSTTKATTTTTKATTTTTKPTTTTTRPTTTTTKPTTTTTKPTTTTTKPTTTTTKPTTTTTKPTTTTTKPTTTTTKPTTTTTKPTTTTTEPTTTTTTPTTTTTKPTTTTTKPTTTTTKPTTTTTKPTTTTTTKATTTTTKATTTTTKPTTTTTKPTTTTAKPTTESITTTEATKPTSTTTKPTEPSKVEPEKSSTMSSTKPSSTTATTPISSTTASASTKAAGSGGSTPESSATQGSVTGSELTIIIVSCVVVGGVVIVIVVIACACACRSKPTPKPTAGQTYMDFQKGNNVYNYQPHDLQPPPMPPPGAMGQQYGMAPPVPMVQQYGMAPTVMHQDPYIVATGHMSGPPVHPILPPGVYPPHAPSMVNTLPRHLAPPAPPMVPVMRTGGAPNRRSRRGPPGVDAENPDDSIYNSLHESDFDNSDGEREGGEDNASYMSIDSADGIKRQNDYYNSVENVNKESDDYENVQEGSGGSLPPGAKQLRDIRDVEYAGIQPMYKPSPNQPMSTSVRRMKALLDQMEDDFVPRKTNKYTKAPSRDASYKTMGKLSTTEDNYVNSLAAKLANRAGTLQHPSKQPDNHEQIPMSYRSLKSEGPSLKF